MPREVLEKAARYCCEARVYTQPPRPPCVDCPRLIEEHWPLDKPGQIGVSLGPLASWHPRC